MSKLRFTITMSLDGYVAGPDQSVEDPLGVGGEQLHEWVLPLEAWRRPHGLAGGEITRSTSVLEELEKNVGAALMGRNMFGGGPGPWGDDPWDGWWGERPPFQMPTFVLTHHPREPLVKEGTTFTFVTEGVEAAVEMAKEAADGKDVALGGGANIAQQCLAAGLIDEMWIHTVPVFLGGGERLFDNLGNPLPKMEQVAVVEAPGVTHVKYRVISQ